MAKKTQEIEINNGMEYYKAYNPDGSGNYDLYRVDGKRTPTLISDSYGARWE